ncbi:MAG: hypothetical protein H0U27_10670 [Nitrosopumilus sp.]|nr:hypothetical protein [Nitrosopumilus sp.]
MQQHYSKNIDLLKKQNQELKNTAFSIQKAILVNLFPKSLNLSSIFQLEYLCKSTLEHCSNSRSILKPSWGSRLANALITGEEKSKLILDFLSEINKLGSQFSFIGGKTFGLGASALLDTKPVIATQPAWFLEANEIIKSLLSQALCKSVPEKLRVYEKFDFKTNTGIESFPCNGKLIPLSDIKNFKDLAAFNLRFPELSPKYDFHTRNPNSNFMWGIVHADPNSCEKSSKDDLLFKIHAKTGIMLFCGKRSILENGGKIKDDSNQDISVNPPNYYHDVNLVRSIGRQLEENEKYAEINTLQSQTLCNIVPVNLCCYPFSSQYNQDYLLQLKNLKSFGSIKINSLSGYDQLLPGLRDAGYNFDSDTLKSQFSLAIAYDDEESKNDRIYKIHYTGIVFFIGTRSNLENCDINDSHYYHDLKLLRLVGKKLEEIQLQKELNSFFTKILCHSIPQDLSCQDNFKFATNRGTKCLPNNGLIIPFGCIKEIPTLSEYDRKFPRLRSNKYNFSSSIEGSTFYWAIDYHDKETCKRSAKDILYKVDRDTGFALGIGTRTVKENCLEKNDDSGNDVPEVTENYYHDVILLINIGKKQEKIADHRLSYSEIKIPSNSDLLLIQGLDLARKNTSPKDECVDGAKTDKPIVETELNKKQINLHINK